jgi:hypothetical protein
MQAILCDVSREPVIGTAWELQLIHGRVPVSSGSTGTSIAYRDGGTMLTLSEDVGRWLLANIEQLRLAYELLREENNSAALLLSEPIAAVDPNALRQSAAHAPRAS